jgi:TP53 regulating kinase-like protein
MSTSTTSTSAIIPEPPRYHNSTWKLLSQGAEARVWLVPNYINIQNSNNNNNNNDDKNQSFTTSAICKERFAKSYRHPVLNDTLTRSRTKAEARSLTRCRRGGVSVPIVLGVDVSSKITDATNNGTNNDTTNGDNNANNDKSSNGSDTSSCLFLENIQGCTMRSFLNIENKNKQDTDKGKDEDSPDCKEPATKKVKLDDNGNKNDNVSNTNHSKSKGNVTRLDAYAKKVAHATGIAIAKMHNVNIIHGDLTTSNILLRNPVPPPLSETDENAKIANANDDNNSSSLKDWNPDIVIIDFGLSSTSVSTSSKKKAASASASCHEERAVDLYVLERAFVTTHVGGQELVDEILRGYKSSCTSSDSVFVRLSQVRLRGRKRECFG